MLSFTAEVLSSLLEAYNRAIWPAQVVACALALALVWLSLSRRPRGRIADWLTGAVLAAAWGWTGAVFHLRHFAGIDFMAPLYGAAFIAEALLIAGWTAWRGGLAPQPRADIEGLAGLGLFAFAVAGYPLLAVIAGDGIAGAPVVGLAPGPTAVLTLALLLLARRPAPLSLAVVPVLWTLLAGWTAWELDLAMDLALPPIGLAALALLILRRQRPPPPSCTVPGRSQRRQKNRSRRDRHRHMQRNVFIPSSAEAWGEGAGASPCGSSSTPWSDRTRSASWRF